MKLSYKMLLIVLIVMTSCNKKVLELDPLNAYSDASLWSDPALAELFVNGIYSQLHYPLSKFSLDVFVDEADRRDGTAVVKFNNSIISPDDFPSSWSDEQGNYFLTWQRMYIAIRACNKFLGNIDKLPDDGTLIDGKTTKDRLTGEVTFLRAWLYYYLTGLYGGVPLVTKAYELVDDFIIPRNTYEECVKFIADECDKAAGLLPIVESGQNKGRVTKGAALTLKSRILIYAASDLYNTVVFPSYPNPELIGYIDKSQRAARWQAAKDAAKAVIDMGIYSLYQADPAPTDSIALNFEVLFRSSDYTTEDIWLRYLVATSYTVPRDGTWMGLSASPGYHGQGNNAPTDNLVRDYEMKDGTKFDWNNPIEAAEPYKNRDPRLYATIFYEGAKWRQRGPAELPLDPNGVIQVGLWQKWNAQTNSEYDVWGLDTRHGQNSPFEAGYTGYYVKKYFDINNNPQFVVADVPWRYMRYAEVLMNYAEACIGLGQDAEARQYINMIRKRAGMPDVTESGVALRDRYRNERRIEMAFEDQRFFDVRRWVIGPQAYQDAYKVNVVYPLLPDKTTSSVPTITPGLLHDYNWIDKAYFMPILRDEMNRNSKLMQNPDY